MCAWTEMGHGVVEAVAEAQWLVCVARCGGGASGLRGMRECGGGAGEQKWRLWLGVGFGKGVVMAVSAARRAAPAEWTVAGTACLRAEAVRQVKRVGSGTSEVTRGAARHPREFSCSAALTLLKSIRALTY